MDLLTNIKILRDKYEAEFEDLASMFDTLEVSAQLIETKGDEAPASLINSHLAGLRDIHKVIGLRAKETDAPTVDIRKQFEEFKAMLDEQRAGSSER